MTTDRETLAEAAERVGDLLAGMAGAVGGKELAIGRQLVFDAGSTAAADRALRREGAS